MVGYHSLMETTVSAMRDPDTGQWGAGSDHKGQSCNTF